MKSKTWKKIVELIIIATTILALSGVIKAFGKESVDGYVRRIAREKGLNPNIASFIVSHESQDGLNMRGDDGQSRGYWQISKVWHPEVSDACADDLRCSTEWSVNRILKGYINEWSTWKFRCSKYTDAFNCPSSQ